MTCHTFGIVNISCLYIIINTSSHHHLPFFIIESTWLLSPLHLPSPSPPPTLTASRKPFKKNPQTLRPFEPCNSSIPSGRRERAVMQSLECMTSSLRRTTGNVPPPMVVSAFSPLFQSWSFPSFSGWRSSRVFVISRA
jgi:hypothetical protein